MGVPQRVVGGLQGSSWSNPAHWSWMELSEFCPRAKTQQPGREAGGESRGLTSELLRGVVQVPCRGLHHTAVIHQPEGQGSSISGTEETISPGVPPSGQGIPGHWGDLQKNLSIAVNRPPPPPHHQVFPFPGTAVKRHGLLGWGWGDPRRHTETHPAPRPSHPPPLTSRGRSCLVGGLPPVCAVAHCRYKSYESPE